MSAEVLYYESHVTLEPVSDEDVDRVSQLLQICAARKFRVAELLMRNRAQSRDDSFCTGRHRDQVTLCRRTRELVVQLQDAGFKVYRYKVEAAVVDSKITDDWELL